MSSIQIPSKDKLILGIMGGIGVISLIAIFMNDDANHTRFWTNILHNSVYFTLIALMAVFFLCVNRTALAGWSVGFKRVWEAMSQFLMVGFVFMAIIAIGVFLHWHHLYHWADEAAVSTDEVLTGKSSFLNKYFYTFGGLGILGSWIFFARKMRSVSMDEDNHGDLHFKHYKKLKFWAGIFLPIAGFSSAAAIWLWVMSVDAHWYSTMFAWYCSASCFVSMLALTILLLIYLKNRGYYHNVNAEHFHDLGKYVFAFSIFWTYLWFAQYMLIWYANIPEETTYFITRQHGPYSILFYGGFIINFCMPIIILMSRPSKRNYFTVTTMALIIIFGHWLDFYQMMMPGPIGEHWTIGWYEIGLLCGFVGLMIFTVSNTLSKASLIPHNNPLLKETVIHIS